MDFLKHFNEVMKKQAEVALATSVDNIPNVRIVNFYYNPEQKGTIYFSSFKDNIKVKEFAQNSRVAFASIPKGEEPCVRVHEATVEESSLTIYDLKDEFINKLPEYGDIIEHAGSQLILFEIHFNEARVTVDFNNSGIIQI